MRSQKCHMQYCMFWIISCLYLLNPPGVFYRVCIVVQMHPQFITSVDKTFCPSCFYREYVKNVEQELGVSVVPYTEVTVKVPMPTCSYSIRRGSPTGPEIRFATVGEPVYHVWSCPSDHYGMLVQNCYVDDGQGNRIMIVDDNGCGVDRYIVQTPKYNEDLTMAYQESHVFKFADKTVTRFTCSIKVCIKAGSGCKGITPPAQCQSFGPAPLHKPHFKAPHYPKHRNVRESGWVEGPSSWIINQTVRSQPIDKLAGGYMDVSGELVVLDSVADTEQAYNDFLRRESYLDGDDEYILPMSQENSVCVPAVGFALLLSFSLLMLAGLAGTTAVLLRSKFCNEKKIHSSYSSSHSRKH